MLDTLLSEKHSDGGYAYPGGDDEEREVAWQAWDETVELFRVWFEMPTDGGFEGAFTDMLSARELLALPGKASTLRWIGGDATLDVIGSLDWKDKRYMRESAKEILEVLKQAPELRGEEVKVKIALAELVCYVGFAAAEGARWGGETLAYATDNMNVRAWLTTRKARCPLARHLLRILGMLESRWNFRTLSYYIRTTTRPPIGLAARAVKWLRPSLRRRNVRGRRSTARLRAMALGSSLGPGGGLGVTLGRG